MAHHVSARESSLICISKASRIFDLLSSIQLLNDRIQAISSGAKPGRAFACIAVWSRQKLRPLDFRPPVNANPGKTVIDTAFYLNGSGSDRGIMA
jgi:hypothetical protein